MSGEAGVGKTTLIAEAARAAFDGGACVLFGHCEEDLATPYQLFAEALGHLVDARPRRRADGAGGQRRRRAGRVVAGPGAPDAGDRRVDGDGR